MVDAPKGGRPKHGPFTTVGWLAVVGGTVLGYILVKRYEADKAATSATAAAPTTEEPLSIGSDTGSASNAAASGSNYTSMQAWVSAMLGAMTGGGNNPSYDPGSAYNDVTAWINGGCVSAAGYSAISSAITNVGLPPGYDPGPLSVCPTSPSTSTPTPTAPATPAAPAAVPSIIGTTDSALAILDSSNFAQKVTSGFQLQGAGAVTGGANSYTQVGTWQGTKGYSGQPVLNGAPVYAYVNGILQQGNMGLVPVGSPIYVPTSLVAKGYVVGDGPTPANA